MAFPAVQTADTKNGVVTTNDASWTITYPTNLVSGDLMIGFIACDGGAVPSTTDFNGFTTIVEFSAGAVATSCFVRVSDGTETGTFECPISGSEQGGWRIYRITGWFGGTVTGTGGATHDATNLSGTSTTSGSPSSTPDPANLNPANWDVEDTLWIAAAGVDTSRTVSVYPLADLNTADVSGGAGGATLALCMANSAVASLNPGTFTISASDDWACLTVAVRPAAAAGPAANPPYRNPIIQLLAH